MAISKIIVNGTTNMDVTQTTATASDVLYGKTLVVADGTTATGTIQTVAAGTPTATTGYITGGTKTGTAVSVSASELVSGSETKTANGTYDVTNLAELVVNVQSGGSSKNVQVAQSTTRVANTAYTKTASLTCAVSGTYDVYWDCFRSTTSGTSGSQLYIGGTASGSANTTFSNHAQNNHTTGVQINANQEVAVYVRSRATNYYAYCGQLTIVQTA